MEHKKSGGGTPGQWLERLSKYVSYVAVLPLFLIMLVAVLDVIGGKVFGQSIQSSVELIQYMNVPLVCLAMGYVEYQSGHTRIRVLTKYYPPLVQKLLYLLGSLIGCVICGYIAYQALGMMVDYIQRQTPIQAASPIPVWPFAFCLILGYVLTGISFLCSGFRAVGQSFAPPEEDKASQEEEVKKHAK